MSAGDRDPLGDGVPSRAGGRAGLGGRIRSTRREIIIHQEREREREANMHMFLGQEPSLEGIRDRCH